MADSHHIIDGKVVPYSGGRKCNNTDAWRDATPLELQLQEQLEEYEHATAAKDAEIEALRAEVERSERYAEQSERERLWAEARAERLAEALRELLIDMERTQANMRSAAKTDPRWEGCAEAIQPRVDAARAALRDQEEGEVSDASIR